MQKVCEALPATIFEEGSTTNAQALAVLLLNQPVEPLPQLMLDAEVSERFSHPACAAVRLLTPERAGRDSRAVFTCESCGGRSVHPDACRACVDRPRHLIS